MTRDLHLPHPRYLDALLSPAEQAEWHAFYTHEARETDKRQRDRG